MGTKKSIFSWNLEQLHQPHATFDWLSRHQITSIYQMVSPEESRAKIMAFLNTAKAYQIEVYFLTGEPEWALDPNGVEVIRMIDQLSVYKKLAKGIVLDIEPHTLEQFKKQPKEVMRTFVASLAKSYKVIKKIGFEGIVCVPYYYDTMGFKSELKFIIEEVSDSAAIMNYFRDKEIEHLKIEAQFAQDVGKPLYNIYELQPPGKHGLKDENTYYNYGLKTIHRNFNALKQAYPNMDLRLSFHEFQYFKRLVEIEEGMNK